MPLKNGHRVLSAAEKARLNMTLAAVDRAGDLIDLALRDNSSEWLDALWDQVKTIGTHVDELKRAMEGT